MTWLSRIRESDPLFLFLILGAFIYVIFASLAGQGGHEKRIDIDRSVLETYLASGGGQALSVAAESDRATSLDNLSIEQRDLLIKAYVEEQAL